MSRATVPFLDVGAGYAELRSECDEAYRRVMASGWYLLGPELEGFERSFADHVGAAACAGVGSGLDALTLALRALDVGPGDEVIVPSNTFVATWLAVAATGADIVPVEPDERSYNLTAAAIQDAISPRTAAIVPVHLYGLPAPVEDIGAVARRHGLPVVYDAAQAHGARVGERPIGAFGDVAAWSFYPGKNLGAFADGGAVTSDRPEVIERVRRLRNYGSSEKYVHLERGANSRLDELQAALLAVKLRHLDAWNDRRRRIAADYLDGLSGLPLQLPLDPVGVTPAWHLFVVQTEQRERLRAALGELGIQTLVHYPVPPHRQAAFADEPSRSLPIAEEMADRLLSLPIGPHLDRLDVGRVVDAVRSLVGAGEPRG